MEFYFLNWVQLSCDFNKVVPNGTTQGYVCPYTLLLSKILTSTCLNHPKFKFKFAFALHFRTIYLFEFLILIEGMISDKGRWLGVLLKNHTWNDHIKILKKLTNILVLNHIWNHENHIWHPQNHYIQYTFHLFPWGKKYK
jgi:hypothetical protein